MRGIVVALVAVVLAGAGPAGGLVVKQALPRARLGAQLAPNPGLEEVRGERAVGWQGWELGYQVDEQASHGGRRSARCHNDSPEEHRGVFAVVTLNQRVPAPIIAECWSKAQGASGGVDGDYSLYLDLEYSDGTPLWGQLAPFSPGTHGWQRREVTVWPAKPVKTVRVHGIFRRRTGTAWFDDFRLTSLRLPGGWAQFDGVPVKPGAAPRAGRPGPVLATPSGLELRFEGTGALLPRGGVYVRDVAAGSDFVLPQGTVRQEAEGTVVQEGEDRGLGLALQVRYRVEGEAIRIEGEVADRRGRDRAVTVYCSFPVGEAGWRWHDDQRRAQVMRPGESYGSFVSVGVGANGQASRYPLACVSGEQEAMALGVPLDQPRLCRLAYDAGSRELYAAFDLGLTPDSRGHPGRASFGLVLYPCDPAWGFRSALEGYYRLFPQCFVKRNRAEGIWMPFTDIATVGGWEDFGFQFKEGSDSLAFDAEHGINSFVYVEPVSLWVNMPPGMERSSERALAYVRELAAQGRPDAAAAASSALEDPYGQWVGGMVQCPWCDGAIYHMNPSPMLEAPPGELTQCERHLRVIESARRAGYGWNSYAGGYQYGASGRTEGSALLLARERFDPERGASRNVSLNQEQARPLTFGVWAKAEGVSGEPDADYALYVDAVYRDGSPGYALAVIAVPTGTHDWQLLERTVTPAQPVRALTFHLLLRGSHLGRAWFDDPYVKEEGRGVLMSDDFVAPAGPVPPPVGVYLDSFEMGSRIPNYRREHLAASDLPVVFDAQGRPCQLLYFHSLEFVREVARRQHQAGGMTFANGTPWDFPWGAAWLDVMGTEVSWAPGGKYVPDRDEVMCYRRALCYQRPYLLLLNTVYEDFPPAWVERYLQRCLAYGVFPSFFSHNAADNPYWQRPDLYNRDRALFKRYIPIIKRLGEAGWEPVTWARADDPHVYLERFGRPGGAILLTAFNDSDKGRRARLTLELAALGATVTGEAKELLSGAQVPLQVAGEVGSLELELGPEEVKVLSLGLPK